MKTLFPLREQRIERYPFQFFIANSLFQNWLQELLANHLHTFRIWEEKTCSIFQPPGIFHAKKTSAGWQMFFYVVNNYATLWYRCFDFFIKDLRNVTSSIL
jgi:hypothetical protein